MKSVHKPCTAGRVKLDDPMDLWDINTSCHNVSAHQNAPMGNRKFQTRRNAPMGNHFGGTLECPYGKAKI